MFSLLVIYKDGSDHPVMNTIWAVVKIKLENKFQACMGVKPMTSVILVQSSSNQANKPSGSWSFCLFVINPWSDDWITVNIRIACCWITVSLQGRLFSCSFINPHVCIFFRFHFHCCSLISNAHHCKDLIFIYM